MRSVPIFADERYQSSFDRGIEVSKERFGKMRDTAYPPRECPLPLEVLTLAISDLLTAESAENVRRMMLTLAVCGAKIEWRRLSGSIVRKSGVMQAPDTRSARRRESGS